MLLLIDQACHQLINTTVFYQCCHQFIRSRIELQLRLFADLPAPTFRPRLGLQSSPRRQRRLSVRRPTERRVSELNTDRRNCSILHLRGRLISSPNSPQHQFQGPSAGVDVFAQRQTGGHLPVQPTAVGLSEAESGGREAAADNPGGESRVQVHVRRRHAAQDQRHGQPGLGKGIRERGQLHRYQV